MQEAEREGLSFRWYLCVFLSLRCQRTRRGTFRRLARIQLL